MPRCPNSIARLQTGRSARPRSEPVAMLAVPPCRLLVARHVAGLRRILDSPFDTKDGKISRPISNSYHPDHEAERAARFPGRRRTRRRGAAARHLGLAQPAISRSIAELERNWARRCSRRHAKGVQLTPVGQAFLRRATAIHHEIQRARDEAGNCAAAVPTARHAGHVHRPAPGAVPRRAAGVPRALSRHPPGNRRRRLSAGRGALLDGSMDFTSARPARARRAAGRAVRQYPRHPGPQGAIRWRRRNPLRELADAHWITTSITHKAEEELGPLFESMACPRRSWRCGRNPR